MIHRMFTWYTAHKRIHSYNSTAWHWVEYTKNEQEEFALKRERKRTEEEKNERQRETKIEIHYELSMSMAMNAEMQTTDKCDRVKIHSKAADTFNSARFVCLCI